jgi:hypothetical protein
VDARTHYTFEVILPTGEPKLPKKVADTFKKKCEVLVRDHVPISVREWNNRKRADDSEYAAERYKESLWNDLMAHFNLPECENEDAARQLRAKVKQWMMTHKYRGSQQSSREVKPKFIDSTQGEPKNICKP